jgi:hypothetical protein
MCGPNWQRKGLSRLMWSSRLLCIVRVWVLDELYMMLHRTLWAYGSFAWLFPCQNLMCDGSRGSITTCLYFWWRSSGTKSRGTWTIRMIFIDCAIMRDFCHFLVVVNLQLSLWWNLWSYRIGWWYCLCIILFLHAWLLENFFCSTSIVFGGCLGAATSHLTLWHGLFSFFCPFVYMNPWCLENEIMLVKGRDVA